MDIYAFETSFSAHFLYISLWYGFATKMDYWLINELVHTSIKVYDSKTKIIPETETNSKLKW